MTIPAEAPCPNPLRRFRRFSGRFRQANRTLARRVLTFRGEIRNRRTNPRSSSRRFVTCHVSAARCSPRFRNRMARRLPLNVRMRWSWRIARIAGIDIDIHATFVILLAWIGLVDYRRAGAAAALEAVLFTMAIFVSVVLHEYGHALTAAQFGVKTRRITLLPIGGVASLERMPDRPRHELLIALAGPAVTFCIVIALYVGLRVAGAPTDAPSSTITGGTAFFAGLMWINVALLLFNLLPAFPMDGGRVLRAAIAMRTDYARATDIAARIGKVFALLFGLAGLFVVNNPFLVVIALLFGSVQQARLRRCSSRRQSATRRCPMR